MSAPRRSAERPRARPRRIDARPRSEAAEGRTFLGMSTPRAIVLAIVVIALASTLAVPLRTYIGQRSEAAELDRERVRLEQDIAALEEQKALIEDPSWIRTEARERLRFVMPGDIPYQVQFPGDGVRDEPENTSERPSTGAWYSDLWRSVVEPPPAPEPPPIPVQMPVAPPEPGEPVG